MKRLAGVLLGVAALGAASLLGGCDFSGLGSQGTRQIAELQAQVDSLSREVRTLATAQHAATALTLQERCQADATRDFKLMGWVESHPVGGSIATFFSHYNDTLGRCLMVLQTTSTVSPYGVATVMFDANEQATYGSLDVVDNRVVTCVIGAPGQPTRRCSSSDAFDKFLVKYMGFTTR